MVPVSVKAMRAAKEIPKMAIMNTRMSNANVFEGRRDRIACVKAMSWSNPNIPRAAMCSEVRTGMNPTKGICIEARVPRA